MLFIEYFWCCISIRLPFCVKRKHIHISVLLKYLNVQEDPEHCINLLHYLTILIAIGKNLYGIPLSFPPLHTVHDIFTSYGVPSIINIDWWPSLRCLLSQVHQYHATAFTNMKTGYVLSCYRFTDGKISTLLAYHVPTFLSLHIFLGISSESEQNIIPVIL